MPVVDGQVQPPIPPFAASRATAWSEPVPRRRPAPSAWADPLGVLPGAGRATSERAAALSIGSVGDLLEHIPVRYERYEDARPVAAVTPGSEATVRVRLRSIGVVRTRRRNLRIVRAQAFDETGPIVAIWFNQEHLARLLQPGDELLLRGRVEPGMPRQITVKAHEVVGDASSDGLHTTGLVPTYPGTEGLPARRIRELVDSARPWLAAAPERLPAWMRIRLRFPSAADALGSLHAPLRATDIAAARGRLAFEELLVIQLGLALIRRAAANGPSARVLAPTGALSNAVRDALPFALTAEQRRVSGEIARDLARSQPMRRLLQGDVGSGKTIVAALALCQAVEAGAQGALLVPTETLAEQHIRTLDELFRPTDCHPVLITGRIGAGERARRELLVSSGTARVVVGTQALLTEGVRFADLGVVVVDEQHRFGVEQRQLLAERARSGTSGPAHILFMTATPIPRTLALTAFGDLRVSTLRGKPPGRRDVATEWVRERDREDAFAAIRSELRAGRQAYVICPLVDGSESGLEARAAVSEAERLAAGPFAAFRVGLAHGAQGAGERRHVMGEFAAGRLDVLVATTVVEVGVDVPNATVIVIEGGDRFGLAQLHQLRGRVGRGLHPGRCLIFADPTTDDAVRRLEAITQEQDGFRLSELDLEIRGGGTVMGLRQSGATDLRFARLGRDRRELAQARAIATTTLRRDPRLASPQHALLRGGVVERFGDVKRLLDA
ncbi:MAG: ATP-dependent DNA helicase RecG [Actinobacteria bacterium]|nr:ATP-dependent DNA helicase RecG [Actinomycetota bacterium]